VEQDGIDAAHGVFRFGLVAGADDEAVATATDAGALGDDVQGGAVAVGREEADGVAFGLAVVADLFGQADGGERTAGAEAFVIGDRRAFQGVAESSGGTEGVAQLGAGGVVDGNADSEVGSMVADATLGDGLAERVFEEDRVGDNLEAVGGPGGGGVVVEAAGLAALVFVREIGAVASAEAIDLSGETEGGAREVDGGGLALFIGFKGSVELPAGEDGGIGDADFFDLFKVEEALAVGQGMQGHHTHRRRMGIEDGKSDHSCFSLGRINGIRSRGGSTSGPCSMFPVA
jgi:hypothetical protein